MLLNERFPSARQWDRDDTRDAFSGLFLELAADGAEADRGTHRVGRLTFSNCFLSRGDALMLSEKSENLEDVQIHIYKRSTKYIR